MKHLMSLAGLSVAGLMLVSCNTQVKEANYQVIPLPQEISVMEQAAPFILSDGTKIMYPEGNERMQKNAEFLASYIKDLTGKSLSVQAGTEGRGILLQLGGSSENPEGYQLKVTDANVVISGPTEAGVFYGIQTLRKSIPVVQGMDIALPAVEISDYPRFSYRGAHLDVSRHFFPVDSVKRFIDMLALHNINRFHWHISDDQGWRIEIKSRPELTEIGSKRTETVIGHNTGKYDGQPYGGFYTQEEAKEIVAYAADRHITVIPEIDMPGHMQAALTAYPELGCTGGPYEVWKIWGISDDVLCAGNDETLKFIDDVLGEIIEIFPSEYIHVGGDECPKSSWKECPLCQKRIREEGLKADKNHSAEEKLQSYFVQRMEKYLSEKHGKKIIGWDEILEGGLAPSATVMSWRGEEGGIAAANMGHEAIMTPGSGGMYIDQFQGDPKIEPVSIGGYDPLSRVYAYNPIPDTLVATGKANLIKGVQTNLWSEYMYNTDLLEYRAYPRVLALAEIGWTPLARKDYKDFERRLDNALVRLDELNINYHIPQPEQPNGSCDFVAFTDKASLEFKTTRPIKVVYTIDGTEPTPESTAYSAPIEFTESGVLKIRSVLPSGKMSKTRTITVEKQALAPAKEVAKTTPGLEMQVTDGMFLNSSKLGDVKEWKKSVIKDLREITSVVKSSESMRGVKQYAAIATGYVNIPEDGVYYISSDNEEVWIDGKLLVNNAGEVKRFSRHDSSAALSKGLHEIKVVFLGHIIGGWPSNWNDGSVKLRKADSDKFVKITPEMLVH